MSSVSITEMDGITHIDVDSIQRSPDLCKASQVGEAPYIKIQSTLRPLTAEFAKEFLAMPGTIWERGLEPRKIAEYAAKMRKGQFNMAMVILASAKCLDRDNQEFRINGQQTCYTRYVHMGDDWTPLVLHNTFIVKKFANLRLLYGSVDQSKSRSTKNNLIGGLYQTPEFPGYTKEQVKGIGVAARLYLIFLGKLQSKNRLNVADLVDIIRWELAPSCRRTLDVLPEVSSSTAFLCRPFAMAAMLAIAEHSGQKQFTKFWSAVNTGANLPDGHPALGLRTWLMNHRVGGSNNRTRDENIITSPCGYAMCIHHWNAMLKGEKITNKIQESLQELIYKQPLPKPLTRS